MKKYLFLLLFWSTGLIAQTDSVKILINFYYDQTPVSNTQSGEYWNFLGTSENDQYDINPLYNTLESLTDLTLEVLSTPIYAYNNGYTGGSVYNDTIEQQLWRADGIGSAQSLRINGLTIGDSCILRVYSNNADIVYGSTQYTFIDTIKTTAVYQNTTKVVWYWTADATSEVFTWEPLSNYAPLQAMEIVMFDVGEEEEEGDGGGGGAPLTGRGFLTITVDGKVKYVLFSEATYFSFGTGYEPPIPPVPDTAFWPLTISDNILVDNQGNPFLMMGDTPWSIMSGPTRTEAISYLDDRASKGINSIMILLVDAYDPGPTNANGDYPFTYGDPFGEMTEDYWLFVDTIMEEIYERDMLALIFPAYLGYNGGEEGWYDSVTVTSLGTMEDYGEWVATRYQDYDNLIWMVGGDYAPNDAIEEIRAMVTGIQNVLGSEGLIFAAHNGRLESGFTEYDAQDKAWLNLNTTYTRGYNLSEYLKDDYSRDTAFFFIEGTYENRNDNPGGEITPGKLRSQMYTPVLMGATGYFFGNDPIYDFGTDWEDELDSDGSLDLERSINFWTLINWSDFIPDNNHTRLTSGYGTLGEYTYAATARDNQDSLIVSYIPDDRAVTYDLTEITSAYDVDTWWFDPSTANQWYLGNYENDASHLFNMPSDTDWIFVLEARDSAKLAYDNFDSYSAAALSGQGSWLQENNTLTVSKPASDGEVYSNTSGDETAAYYNSAVSNDQWSQITVANALGTGDAMGVAVRCSGGSGDYYSWYSTPATSYLARTLSGSWSQLTTGDPWAVGDIARLVAHGDTLKCYKNGILDTSIDSDGKYTDNGGSKLSSGYVGLAGYNNDNTVRVDEWQGGAWPITPVSTYWGAGYIGSEPGPGPEPGLGDTVAFDLAHTLYAYAPDAATTSDVVLELTRNRNWVANGDIAWEILSDPSGDFIISDTILYANDNLVAGSYTINCLVYDDVVYDTCNIHVTVTAAADNNFVDLDTLTNFDYIPIVDGEYTYLKRGSVAALTQAFYVNGTDNWVLGAYGTGARPQMETNDRYAYARGTFDLSGCAGSQVRDIDIYNNNSISNFSTIYLSGTSDGIIIDNCEIHGNGNAAFSVIRVAGPTEGGAIRNCILHDVYDDAVQVYADMTGVSVADRFIWEGNWIYNVNKGSGGGDCIQFANSTYPTTDRDSRYHHFRYNLFDRTNNADKYAVLYENGNTYAASDVGTIFEYNRIEGYRGAVRVAQNAVAFGNSRGAIFRYNVVNGTGRGLILWSDYNGGTTNNDIQIYGNLFNDCDTSSIRFHTGDADNVDIFNNTFVNYAEDGGAAIVIDAGNTGADIRNNIFYYATGADDPIDGTVGTEDYNIYWPDALGYSYGGNSDELDPGFVTGLHSDYEINTESNAYQFGTDVGLTTDLWGTSWLDPPSVGYKEYVDFDVPPSPSEDTLILVYSNDFDDLTAGGIYLTPEWEADYPNRPPWYPNFTKQSNSRIVNTTLDGITSQYLRYWIGEDTDFGDSDHGIDFKGWFDADSTGYEELYYGYDWYIPTGQDFRGYTGSGKTGSYTEGTGKIPSAGGWYWYTQDLSHSFPYYDEGFSAGIRWKSNGSGTNLFLTSYLYTHNLISEAPYTGHQGIWAGSVFQDPDDWPSVYYFPNGEWHHIAVRVVMNDVDPQVDEEDWDNNDLGDGDKNGIYEVFIDGKLSLSIDTLIWRNLPGCGVDVMKMYTMSNRYQDEDIYWYTDNFHYWYIDSTFAVDNDIPWGNTETYSEGDTLYFPQSWSHVGFGYVDE